MATKIMSFGHRYGVPENGVVIDIRKLFHGGFYPFDMTGLDPQVGRSILIDPSFEEFYLWIREAANMADAEFNIGCHDGMHRSVFIADKLGKELNTPVLHRDIMKSYLRKTRSAGVR